MNKVKVKEFWEKNKGKIIIIGGVAATVSLAVVGCKVKHKHTPVVTTGLSYGFNEPTALKDILSGNHHMLDGLPEFLSQKNLTVDALVTSVTFKLKEPITD